MIRKKHLLQVVGGIAFVVGGLFAREKTFEVVDTLEKTFDKHKTKSESTEDE